MGKRKRRERLEIASALDARGNLCSHLLEGDNYLLLGMNGFPPFGHCLVLKVHTALLAGSPELQNN